MTKTTDPQRSPLRRWARTHRDEMIEWRDLWRTLPDEGVLDVAGDLSAETLFVARGQVGLAHALESLAERSAASFAGER